MAFLGCLSSAILFVLSFPRAEWSPLAWVALVPFLCTLNGQKPWTAFRRGYCFGFLFFAAAIGWIVYVTPPGAILLVAFLSLYFAVFAALFVYFQPLAAVPRVFILAMTWTALEFVRAHFLSGFGWVMLGHSQYKNYQLIQMADITGAFGVSFVVMLVNLLLFETWRSRSLLPQATAAVAAVLYMVLMYGHWVTGEYKFNRMVKVGVVQPNIPLAVDWDESKKPWIVDKTISLSQRLKDQKLDLIVWPEMSLPGVITDAPFLTGEIQSLAAQWNTPFLIGSIAQDGDNYFNSAFLIGADGRIGGRYDKIHLVPFGEFLPLRPVLGWINKFVALDDFTYGKNYKVFSIGPAKFSVLICFEDTLGCLARRFAMKGADFFVNMTNDAWFKETRAPFLHLAAAVFTCVENHRSLVRAANTGVSALVDPLGRIVTTVSNGKGRKLFVEGYGWGWIPLNSTKTFYTKYGDIFTYLCFLCILVAGVVVWKKRYN